MLAEMRKQPGQQDLNKEDALNVLHREEFTWSLDRCSKLPNALPEHFKDHLLDMVMGDGQDGVLGDSSLITPFIWAGLLTKIGKFSRTLLQDGTTTIDAFQIEQLRHPKVLMSSLCLRLDQCLQKD